MPDKILYYAVVDELSSREEPAGLFRRTYTEAGDISAYPERGSDGR